MIKKQTQTFVEAVDSNKGMNTRKAQLFLWTDYLGRINAIVSRMMNIVSITRSNMGKQLVIAAMLSVAIVTCVVEQSVENRVVAGMYEKSLHAAKADAREISTFLELTHQRVQQSIRLMQDDLNLGSSVFSSKRASRMALLEGLKTRVEVVRAVKSRVGARQWLRESGALIAEDIRRTKPTVVSIPQWDDQHLFWGVSYFSPANAVGDAVLVTLDISGWLAELDARGSAYEDGGISIYSPDGMCYGSSNPRLGFVGEVNASNAPLFAWAGVDEGVQEADLLASGELPHSHVYRRVPGPNLFVVVDLLSPGVGVVEQQLWAVRIIFVLVGVALLLLFWWQFRNTLEIKVIHKVAQAAETSYQEQISEKSKQIEETNKELRILAVTFHSKLGVLITDKNAKIVRANLAFQEMTGYEEAELIGRNPNILSSGEHDTHFYAKMWKSVLENNFWSGVIVDRRKDGSLLTKETTITAVRGAEGAIDHYVSISEDLTELKKKENEIERLAFFDPLTNLPNRRLFLDRLTVAVSTSKRRKTISALVYVDLDNFKLINDSLGHVVGDDLLATVATRLQAISRAEDTVCRFGGDEFVVLLQGVGDSDAAALTHATEKAEEIKHALARPYLLGGSHYVCTASIGVSLVDAQELPTVSIGHADLAMYQAKRHGKNQVEVFESAMEERQQSRIAIERKLRHAIDNKEFSLYLQPQVDTDGRMVSAEALIRWKEKDGGLISPADFIPVAEETGLILDIGTWVLQEACRILGELTATEGVPADFRLSVNISAMQFAKSNFVDLVRETVAQHAVPAHRLVLELTESIAVSGITDVARKMRMLREEVGVVLSLDDFGTGYSSLSYLQKLPFDEIKIDRSFVQGIEHNPVQSRLLNSIITLSADLGMAAIVEGVETDAQAHVLRSLGCGVFQGYLFSRPLPLDAFVKQVFRPSADSLT